MIKPLFGALFPILGSDKTSKNLNQVLILWKSSFKSMMLIPRRTGSQLVKWMIGKELADSRAEYKETNLVKWLARKMYRSCKIMYKEMTKNHFKESQTLAATF